MGDRGRGIGNMVLAGHKVVTTVRDQWGSGTFGGLYVDEILLVDELCFLAK